MSLRIVKPAVIAAAQSLLFDPPKFQRRAAVRAMRFKRADAPLLVAEDDHLLAEDFHFLGQVAKLIGGANRLPITPQQLAHRTSGFDDGEVVRCGTLRP